MMSPAPPAANGKITRTGLLGYTCAQHTPAAPSIRPNHALTRFDPVISKSLEEQAEPAPRATRQYRAKAGLTP